MILDTIYPESQHICTIFVIFFEKNASNSVFRVIFASRIKNFILNTISIMNKTELINAVAEKANLTKVQAKAALDATLNTITEALLKDDKVAIIGFGTFGVSEKTARTGINPRTKEKIEIPARKVVKFKPGAELNLVK